MERMSFLYGMRAFDFLDHALLPAKVNELPARTSHVLASALFEPCVDVL